MMVFKKRSEWRKIFKRKRFRSTLKMIILSILSGAILVIITLIRPSIPLLSEVEKTVISWLMFTRAYIFPRPQSEPFVFIDVSNDNVLKEGNDGKQRLLTDRKKLSELLTLLSQRPNQVKFILCDLLVEDTTSFDQQFLRAINQLSDKILFIKSVDEQGIIRQPLYPIPAAVAAYEEINGSFLTYPLYYGQEPTAPLVMFQRIHSALVETKSTWISRLGVKINGNYNHTYSIVDLRINNSDVFPSSKGSSYLYYELGNFLSLSKSVKLSQLLSNKQSIIVVGGFAAENNTDMHNSLLKEVSGPLLIIDTYIMLRERDTQIRISWLLFLLTCFSCITYNVISHNFYHRFSRYTYKFPKSGNWVINKALEFLKGIISTSVVWQLVLLSVASYVVFHEYIQIVLLSVILSLPSLYNKAHRLYKYMKL